MDKTKQFIEKFLDRLSYGATIDELVPFVKKYDEERCEHNFQILNNNYYKPTGETNGLGFRVYDQTVTYSMLYCTKCGTTKEVISM